MRFLAGLFAASCLLLVACRTMPDLSHNPAQSAAPESELLACPDGLPSQPGLTDFGAYIGTWQAYHARIQQSGDYVIAADSGRVNVQCDAANYVVAEDFTLTFQVPGGRAVQFALTDLPADSRKIFDHSHPACRSLQYQSKKIAAQLPADDRGGLVDITMRSPTRTYNLSAVSTVDIRIATSLGDDSRPC
ncbi:MAG TPA: hypothetical protein VG364_01020 [Candidatus Dormibacteraeota bacterium]|jgi:hypothetical protein|nr:hypothetical protein [Candidatus Dormibacteraeota bacterium]